MDNKEKSSFMAKLIYWSLSTFFIIVLFLIFFGLLGPFIIEKNLDPARIIGVVISGAGSALLLFAIFKPLLLVKKHFHFDSKSNIEYSQKGMAFVYGIIGGSLLVGGFLYSHRGEPIILVLSFAVPVAVLLLLRSVLNK